MSLEATLILLDNSDHARNGDYMPTRWDAETDAAALISNAKFNAHPENAVGLMTMAGKQCEILATPTQDSSKIMACLHGVHIGGTVHLSNALQIAQLALKHRLNKNQRQRILVFIASPVAEDEATLVNLAKKLKKNNVAVDVINMGQQEEEHKLKLEKFVETVKNADNSNIIHILPGINFVSDSLIGTPILGGNNFGGIGNNEFGGDDGNDPELAMALRISLETERDRKKREEEEAKKNDTDKNKIEEEKKENAIEVEKGGDDIDDMDEEEILKRAQELSQQKPEPIQEEKQEEKKAEPIFQDKDFVNDLLNSLGVDQNDPSIQDALKGLDKEGEEKKEEKK